ncbi:MAG: DUF177 domain-containing protein [Lachnospiraceae bacterium]|nr:DUF177 domain-containing protein [Lachnospiraceae bacterium]MBO4560210.1 DUF177 domain-containing protein [Lachnospiraceae bacterium]
MRISLSGVMNLNSETRDFTADIESESFMHMGESYPVAKKEPVRFTAVSDTAKTVRIKAQTKLELTVPCDRCLEPVSVPFDIDTDYVFTWEDDGTVRIRDDEEPVNYIDGYELDVDAFISEEIMIGFPMKVLCTEDCKGICSVCGANLNRGECGCDRTVLDPRMSIIRDLFRQKEV